MRAEATARPITRADADSTYFYYGGIVAALGVGDTSAGLPNPRSTGPRAITNAIYVDVDGNGAGDPPGGKTCSYDIR